MGIDEKICNRLINIELDVCNEQVIDQNDKVNSISFNSKKVEVTPVLLVVKVEIIEDLIGTDVGKKKIYKNVPIVVNLNSNQYEEEYSNEQSVITKFLKFYEGVVITYRCRSIINKKETPTV